LLDIYTGQTEELKNKVKVAEQDLIFEYGTSDSSQIYEIANKRVQNAEKLASKYEKIAKNESLNDEEREKAAK
jgi:hypothetical protein